MLSVSTISRYIDTVPPLPKILKACSQVLDEGDLVKAADLAAQDPALIHYLKEIVNKPIFGFRGEVKDPRQIFGVLGLTRARQILYSYYILLLLPRDWDVFDFNTRKFQDLQASMMIAWEKILLFLKCDDQEVAKAVTLVPATIAVCESIFKEHVDTVALIRGRTPISYEAILYKMTQRNFFDIAVLIAKKWELSPTIMEILSALGKDTVKHSATIDTYVDYLKLLINYELSRPEYIKSGLNDFFDMYVDVSPAVMEAFFKTLVGDE